MSTSRRISGGFAMSCRKDTVITRHSLSTSLDSAFLHVYSPLPAFSIVNSTTFPGQFRTFYVFKTLNSDGTRLSCRSGLGGWTAGRRIVRVLAKVDKFGKFLCRSRDWAKVNGLSLTSEPPSGALQPIMVALTTVRSRWRRYTLPLVLSGHCCEPVRTVTLVYSKVTTPSHRAVDT